LEEGVGLGGAGARLGPVDAVERSRGCFGSLSRAHECIDGVLRSDVSVAMELYYIEQDSWLLHLEFDFWFDLRIRVHLRPASAPRIRA
jgi:hypothetical protein